MRINPMPVYQKGERKKRGNNATPTQRERWERIRAFGCIICAGAASIHHCGTGGGGRKDHDKVLGLCHYHHQGDGGIHNGRKAWQKEHGSEAELMERTAKLLGELPPVSSSREAKPV